MALKGLNDTVTILERVHTSDNRGGVTTTYSTKIASLVCSLQSVRREELRMEPQGQTVTEPYMLLFDIITSGNTVAKGDVVEHGDDKFLVVMVVTTSGLGAHTEAILKKVDGEAIIK